MQNAPQREKHIIDWTPVTMSVEAYENQIDTCCSNAYNVHEIEQISTSLASVAQCEVGDFATALGQKAEVSKFASSIGSVCTGTQIFTSIDEIESHANISAVASKPKGVSPEFLSKIWNIDNKTARGVIQQNTQLLRQNVDNDLSKQFTINDRMLRYKRINSQFYTDTFFAGGCDKTTRGNTCAQMSVSDKGFVAIYPMKSKGDFKDSLHLFCKEVGVPVDLVVNPSGERTSKEVTKFCHQVGTTLRILEESTQWANRAELYIGIFKESIRKDLHRTNSPMRLWDYCAKRRMRIHNATPRDLFQLNGNTPNVVTFGTQADISNLCQFDWYDWCYFREEGKHQFPGQKKQLGRVLGPIKNEGNKMCQAVLKSNGKVVPRRTVRRLNVSERHSEVEKKYRDEFDKKIHKLYGTSMVEVDTEVDPTPDYEEIDFIVDDDSDNPLLYDKDPVDATGKPVLEKPFCDYLLHAEVLLPQQDSMKTAKIIGRYKDKDGQSKGIFDENLLLNSIIYNVELTDGAVKQYAANVIAENMFSQVDEHGRSVLLLDAILDSKRDGNAVHKDDKYIIPKLAPGDFVRPQQDGNSCVDGKMVVSHGYH